jgi:type II secretory pathway component PulF
LFKSLNAKLPQSLILSLTISNILQQYWIYVIPIVIVLIIYLAYMDKDRNGLGWIGNIFLAIIFGSLAFTCYISVNQMIAEIQKQLS